MKSEFSAINKKAWDYKSYDYWLKKYGKPQDFANMITAKKEQIVERYLPYMDLENERQSILNIGGSKGKVALALTLLGHKVTIVDISEDGKQYALETAKYLDVKLDYINADILDARFNNEYDIVFMSIGVLHWFENLEKLLAVINLALKPGGTLVICDFHPLLKVLYPVDGKIMDYFDTKPFWGDMPYAKYYENENFPKGLYKEHTLSNIINTIIGAGFNICRFDEYPFHDEKIPCKFIIKAKKIMSDSR